MLWLLSVRLLRRGARPRPDGALFALTSLALGLVRPDGNLVACVTAMVVLLVSPRPARAGLLRHLTALYVLPGAAYFAWRWSYYGHPLPLPFYVKAEHTAPLAGLDEGVAFLADLLWRGVPIGLLALVGAASQPRRAAAPLAASGALFAFYLVPAPLMAYDHRYLHPIVFAAAALAGCGVSELGARLDTRLARRRGWGPGRFEGLAFACLVAAVPVTFLARLSTSVADKVSYATGLEKAHLTLGRRLAALDEHGGGSRRVALLDAGAVPYASRWTTIDTFGLNEPRIARSGRHDAAYVLDRSPDVLVTISSRRDRFEAVFDFEAELQREARGRGYVPVDVLTFVPGYELWVMARGPIAFKDERPGRHP